MRIQGDQGRVEWMMQNKVICIKYIQLGRV